MSKSALQPWGRRGGCAALNRCVRVLCRSQVYVTHRLLEHGKELSALIMGGAYFYVCGDGAHMAKDVNKALVTILEEHSGLKEKDVSAHVRNMTQQGKYVRDIWA